MHMKKKTCKKAENIAALKATTACVWTSVYLTTNFMFITVFYMDITYCLHTERSDFNNVSFVNCVLFELQLHARKKYVKYSKRFRSHTFYNANILRIKIWSANFLKKYDTLSKFENLQNLFGIKKLKLYVLVFRHSTRERSNHIFLRWLNRID